MTVVALREFLTVSHRYFQSRNEGHSHISIRQETGVMRGIRPVSDSRNKFFEIDESVYLPQKGYGSIIVLSLERSALIDDIEMILDEENKAAE